MDNQYDDGRGQRVQEKLFNEFRNLKLVTESLYHDSNRSTTSQQKARASTALAKLSSEYPHKTDKTANKLLNMNDGERRFIVGKKATMHKSQTKLIKLKLGRSSNLAENSKISEVSNINDYEYNRNSLPHLKHTTTTGNDNDNDNDGLLMLKEDEISYNDSDTDTFMTSVASQQRCTYQLNDTPGPLLNELSKISERDESLSSPVWSNNHNNSFSCKSEVPSSSSLLENTDYTQSETLPVIPTSPTNYPPVSKHRFLKSRNGKQRLAKTYYKLHVLNGPVELEKIPEGPVNVAALSETIVSRRLAIIQQQQQQQIQQDQSNHKQKFLPKLGHHNSFISLSGNSAHQSDINPADQHFNLSTNQLTTGSNFNFNSSSSSLNSIDCSSTAESQTQTTAAAAVTTELRKMKAVQKSTLARKEESMLAKMIVDYYIQNQDKLLK